MNKRHTSHGPFFRPITSLDELEAQVLKQTILSGNAADVAIATSAESAVIANDNTNAPQRGKLDPNQNDVITRRWAWYKYALSAVAVGLALVMVGQFSTSLFEWHELSDIRESFAQLNIEERSFLIDIYSDINEIE